MRETRAASNAHIIVKVFPNPQVQCCSQPISEGETLRYCRYRLPEFPSSANIRGGSGANGGVNPTALVGHLHHGSMAAERVRRTFHGSHGSSCRTNPCCCATTYHGSSRCHDCRRGGSTRTTLLQADIARVAGADGLLRQNHQVAGCDSRTGGNFCSGTGELTRRYGQQAATIAREFPSKSAIFESSDSDGGAGSKRRKRSPTKNRRDSVSGDHRLWRLLSRRGIGALGLPRRLHRVCPLCSRESPARFGGPALPFL